MKHKVWIVQYRIRSAEHEICRHIEYDARCTGYNVKFIIYGPRSELIQSLTNEWIANEFTGKTKREHFCEDFSFKQQYCLDPFANRREHETKYEFKNSGTGVDLVIGILRLLIIDNLSTQVTATDGDKDRPQDIVYFLTGQGIDPDNPANSKFDINRTSGEIYVLKVCYNVRGLLQCDPPRVK